MKQLLVTLSVAIFACATLALAQDSTSAHSAVSNKGPANIQAGAASADLALQLLRQSRTGDQPVTFWRLDPGATLRLSPNALAAGCYTMRIYKVKRSERLQGGDTGRRGYATCEPGGEFQVRTATATATNQPNSK